MYQMPKPGRLYLCLDVEFFDEHCALSDSAQLLFLEMLTRAKQLRCQGHLTTAQVQRCAPRHLEAMPELVAAGLVTNENEAEPVCFPSWNDWNGEAEAKQRAGRKGGIASGIARRVAKQNEAAPSKVLQHSRDRVETEKSRELLPRRSSPAPQSRPRDEAFDAVAEACEMGPQFTKGEASLIAAAKNELTKVGETPESIRELGALHRQVWAGLSVTPSSLIKNRSILRQGRNGHGALDLSGLRAGIAKAQDPNFHNRRTQ